MDNWALTLATMLQSSCVLTFRMDDDYHLIFNSIMASIQIYREKPGPTMEASPPRSFGSSSVWRSRTGRVSTHSLGLQHRTPSSGHRKQGTKTKKRILKSLNGLWNLSYILNLFRPFCFFPYSHVYLLEWKHLFYNPPRTILVLEAYNLFGFTSLQLESNCLP